MAFPSSAVEIIRLALTPLTFFLVVLLSASESSLETEPALEIESALSSKSEEGRATPVAAGGAAEEEAGI